MNKINNREIISQIINIIKKKDKNNNDYLILEMDNDGDIFVFPFRVAKETWKNLQKGKNYRLILEEGKGGLNLLTSFAIERRENE